ANLFSTVSSWLIELCLDFSNTVRIVAASTVSVTTDAVMLSNVAEKSATEIYFDVFIVAPLYHFYQNDNNSKM
ncbi:hypothetical protein ACXO0S_06625, partial [Lactobacillus delbrueckii subsp. bulgaricus]